MSQTVEYEIQVQYLFRTRPATLLFDPQEKTLTINRTSGRTTIIQLPQTSIIQHDDKLCIVRKSKSQLILQFANTQFSSDAFNKFKEYTKTLQTSLLLDEYPEPIVMSNTDGIIISVNKLFLEKYEYDKSIDLIGENVSILMDEYTGKHHDRYMQDYKKSGVRRLIGKERLIRMKTGKGKLVPCVIQLGEMIESLEGKPIVRLVATFRAPYDSDNIPLTETITSREDSYYSTQTQTESSEEQEDWSDESFAKQLFNPLVIEDKLCTMIELMGLEVDGIFRISGNYETIENLWQCILVGDFDDDSLDSADPHVLVGVLKKLLVHASVFPNGPLADELIQLAEKPDSSEKLLAVIGLLKKLPQEHLLLMGRLLLTFSQVYQYRSKNKMSSSALGNFCVPLFLVDLLQPTVMGKCGELFKFIVENIELLLYEIPIPHFFTLYTGPLPLSDRDWALLMTNSETMIPFHNTRILVEGDENSNLYYIVGGEVLIEKGGLIVATLSTGDFFGEMSLLKQNERISASVIAGRSCTIRKFNLQFLRELFASNQMLFFQFNWHLAQQLAKRLAILPFSFTRAHVPTTPRFSQPSESKLEVFLPDGTSTWVSFALEETVGNVMNLILARHPSLPRDAHLIESSHGRPVMKIHPSWQANQLLLRAKYASDYKVSVGFDQSKHKIGTDESLVISQFPCKRKKVFGTMFIKQTQLLHVTAILTLQAKHVILFSDITRVTSEGAWLEVFTKTEKSHKFLFKSKGDCVSVRNLVQLLVFGDGSKIEVYRRASTDVEEYRWAYLKRRCRFGPYVVEARELVKVVGSTVTQFACICKDNTDVLIGKDDLEFFSFDQSFEAICSSLRASGLCSTDSFPSRATWMEILSGGKVQQYSPGEIIVCKFSRLQRIFHIISGTCSVEFPVKKGSTPLSEMENSPLVEGQYLDHVLLNELQPGEFFGENGFLMAEGSMARVVASGNPTTVILLEPYYLKDLFQRKPKLGGRFCFYLQAVIGQRIRNETGKRVNLARSCV